MSVNYVVFSAKTRRKQLGLSLYLNYTLKSTTILVNALDSVRKIQSCNFNSAIVVGSLSQRAQYSMLCPQMIKNPKS